MITDIFDFELETLYRLFHTLYNLKVLDMRKYPARGLHYAAGNIICRLHNAGLHGTEGRIWVYY